MANILTPAQAEAVYSAMGALTNVGVKCYELRFSRAVFSADSHGAIHVYSPESDERYANHSDFASAYDLQTEAQKRRQERRERDEPYLMYGIEETRTGNRA